MVTKLDITKIQQFLKRNEPEALDLHDIVRLAGLMTETMLILIEDNDQRTYEGLTRISQQISDTKKDLAEFSATEMHEEHIPEAGRELDAVVEATESATNRIMEAAENIMAGDPSDPEAYSAMVNDNVMEIFEACSFQDITGQRIGKVVRTLNLIEEQIGSMISSFDAEKKERKTVRKRGKDEEPQDVLGDLLNGPAFEGEGVNQADVDALFGSGANI